MGNYNEFDLDLNISYEEKTGNNTSGKNGSTFACDLSQGITELFTEHFNEQYLDIVCKDIGIQKIIDSFTKGINTQLGHWFDNGTNISTGQWQKIALAGAAYRNGDIFIFDEPNAALDKISEQDFIRFYKERCQDKLGIIISHKIDDSVKMADEILVLQDGEIVERGNYQNLMQNGALFKKFLT